MVTLESLNCYGYVEWYVEKVCHNRTYKVGKSNEIFSQHTTMLISYKQNKYENFAFRYGKLHTLFISNGTRTTVVPTKSDSDAILCLQLLS